MTQLAAFLVSLLLAAVALPAAGGERVRVGIYENSPKVGTSETGKPEGVFVDLIEAVAKKEGWTLEYVPGTWSEGLARLAAAKIDLMPDVALTAERERDYDFHGEPVLSSWNQIYARRGSGIRSLLDLEGRRVAVLEGSTQQDLFVNMVAGFSLKVELVPQPDFAAAFRAVAEGRADAVVTNRFYGIRHAAGAGLEDTNIIFNPSRLHFAAPKRGNPALLDAIDRHLVDFKKDPSSPYYASLHRWTGDETRPAAPAWLGWTAAAALALLLAAVAWVVLLRRQVAAKTRVIVRRNEEMELVNRILRSTSTQLDMPTLLDEATRGALSLTGFDGGVLCLRDSEQGRLRVGARLDACAGTGPAPDGEPLRDEICPAMLACVAPGQRYALIAAGAPGAPMPCGNVGGAGVRWNAYFQLEARGQTIGILCLFSRRAEKPDAHVLALVEDLCGPIALAMENARLYGLAQQHADELEARVAKRTHQIAELGTFLQAIINHVANPIFYKGADLRFRGCNDAYEQAFGVNRADFIGKTVLDLDYLPPADRQAYQAEDAATLAAGTTVQREAAIPFADGREHQTLYSVSGFRGPDGTPGGLVGIIVDITPLKETEAALAEAKYAAEAADRLKSAFLATMSHELRTPLNSIIGFTGLVLQELPGPLNEEQKKQLGMVRASARHLLALINDVLDISRIEAGELTFAAEPFDLAAAIGKVAGIVAPLAAAKGLALRVEGTANAGQMQGDSRRVEQILFNLLSNAIKFTETGWVSLRVEPVADHGAAEGAAPGPAVRLRVADSGIGIRPEDMAQLFQPFRQIDSALSRAHEGTGLGLVICRRLAALMGGSIEAESRFGEGSVFSLMLPLCPRAATEAP